MCSYTAVTSVMNVFVVTNIAEEILPQVSTAGQRNVSGKEHEAVKKKGK